ncbi:pyridoxamine 5'-phosphate oxidase family protein [Rhizobium oryziradicis]|uniref:General stress protein n=1 Tax=Rhizobium oryziradicis TaxID=1867956 RepID=A0A1Q8ZPX4_9HYPH|nr:pyridoxamine 5'-phosphate oxidase family protein [Rhizobium oryziradicis]OLP44103.1 general stress protein [Rhizobium oryziradicis]
MANITEAVDAPANQLWKEIDAVHAGMLGLEGSTKHMQPMAPYSDPTTNTVWFFTKTDSELAMSIRPGSRAHFCVIGKNHDYHACLGGVIELRKDQAKIDEHWSSIVEAWYEGGKNDPTLTMLAMHVDDAEIWASTGNPLKFGWEIAKANFDDSKMPDVGVHRHLNFA